MNTIVQLTDLGNAYVETKQWDAFPYVTDSSYQLGMFR